MNRGIGLAILIGLILVAGCASEPPTQQPEAAKPLAPAEPVKVAGNLLADGGFEDAYAQIDQHGNPFNQWGGWKWEGTCSRDVDRTIRHSGKSCAMLMGETSCMIAYMQKFAVGPGFYKLSGYVRAAGLRPGKWNRTLVLAFEAEGMKSKTAELPGGTYGWRKFEDVLKFDGKHDETRLYTYLYGPGRVWLDDLSLVKLEGEDHKVGITLEDPEEKLPSYAGADAVKCLACGTLITPNTDRCPVCGASNKPLREAAEKAAAEKRAREEAAAKASEKLIQDGGFEAMYDKPDQHGNAFRKWSGWKAEGEATRGADTEIKHSGRASAVLTGMSNPCHIWHGQSLVTEPGYYKLTGWIRADNKPGKWGQGAVIAFEAEGKTLGSDKMPTGTYGWRKFERVYKFDKKHSPNRLYLYTYGIGKVWFDDLKMEKLEGTDHKVGMTLFDPEEKVEVSVAPAEAPVGAGEPKAQPKPSGKDGVRLWQYVRSDTKEYFNYGLKVVPPWEDGGYLRINFPEHLEYMPGTRGILRYSDKGAKGHWIVSGDGMSAELDVESVTEPGVFVHGVAKVVSKNRIEISMKIINKTERLTLGAIRPLYCHQYQPLKGFPQWRQNLEHTFFLIGGKLTPLSEVKTAKADARIKAGSVRGNPQQKDSPFAVKRGGWIEEGVDASIVVVTGLNNKRALVFGWTPGKSAFTNSVIPCVHADPYYGDIKPGESKEAKEIILFTEKDPANVVKELLAEGIGKPVRR